MGPRLSRDPCALIVPRSKWVAPWSRFMFVVQWWFLASWQFFFQYIVFLQHFVIKVLNTSDFQITKHSLWQYGILENDKYKTKHEMRIVLRPAWVSSHHISVCIRFSFQGSRERKKKKKKREQKRNKGINLVSKIKLIKRKENTKRPKHSDCW